MASQVSMEERMKAIDHFVFGQENGFKILLTHLPEYKEGMELSKTMDIRPDDVMMIGYVRSGNHWAYEVVGMILQQKVELKGHEFIDQLFEFLGKKVLDNYDKEPSPRQLVSHIRTSSIFPDQAYDKKTKIVYLMRNPKDVYLSWYHFITNFNSEFENFTFRGSFDDFLHLDFAGELHYGNWFGHVLDMEKFMNEHPDIPVHIHVYEEMKANPEQCTRDLCRFLGYPEDLAADIVAQTHIGKMRENKKFEEFASRYFKEEVKDNIVLRKGNVGGWQNVLTEEQNKMLDDEFERRMAGCKLADRIRPYMKKQV